MIKKIKEELNIKPLSVNMVYARGKGKRLYKTENYLAYEKEVLFTLPKHETIEGKVAIEYEFYLEHPLTCDYDNFIKPLQDLIVKKGWIKDDRYIFDARIRKFKGRKNKIVIVIYKI